MATVLENVIEFVRNLPTLDIGTKPLQSLLIRNNVVFRAVSKNKFIYMTGSVAYVGLGH